MEKFTRPEAHPAQGSPAGGILDYVPGKEMAHPTLRRMGGKGKKKTVPVNRIFLLTDGKFDTNILP